MKICVGTGESHGRNQEICFIVLRTRQYTVQFQTEGPRRTYLSTFSSEHVPDCG